MKVKTPAKYKGNAPMTYYVLRNKKTGKYYRGARFWKWTKNWRGAAMLKKDFWNIYLNKMLSDETELISVYKVLHSESN